ncbi:MAG: hypothetical protein HN909_05400 [Phycisphaerales bacterium]|jgi:hypothetical protein|nr:hypothetical protein [Phycisphaerales bacterium]MBT7171189.1 hypothetical protein [Phycisphaerales bacterium]
MPALANELFYILIISYIALMFFPKPIVRKKWYALGWLTMVPLLVVLWMCCSFGWRSKGFVWLPNALVLLPLITLVFACYPCGACCILEDAGMVSVKTQEPAEETTEE